MSEKKYSGSNTLQAIFQNIKALFDKTEPKKMTFDSYADFQTAYNAGQVADGTLCCIKGSSTYPSLFISKDSENLLTLGSDGGWKVPHDSTKADQTTVNSLSQSLSDMKYSDISGIGVFGNRLNTTKLKLKKNGYGKVDFFFEGTIATNLTAGQDTFFTIDNTVIIPNMILYGSINGIATQFIMDKTYNHINRLDSQAHTTNDKVIISGSWYV